MADVYNMLAYELDARGDGIAQEVNGLSRLLYWNVDQSIKGNAAYATTTHPYDQVPALGDTRRIVVRDRGTDVESATLQVQSRSRDVANRRWTVSWWR